MVTSLHSSSAPLATLAGNPEIPGDYDPAADLPRFYCAIPLAPGAEVELPPVVAAHATRALRLGPDAPLVLFDGRGGEYPAVLTQVRKDRAWARLGTWQDVARESPLEVILGQAIQAADKMDWTVQKAVELGVSAIHPLMSRRSVVRLEGERAGRRVAHWQGIAAAACEQCGRNRLPAIAPVVKVENFLAQVPAPGLKLMLAPGGETTLDRLPRPTGPVILLIGAEGGLDPEEARAARSVGFLSVSLGPRILRTETAGVAALAALQVLWGDWRTPPPPGEAG